MVDPRDASDGASPSLAAASELAQALASRICHDLVSPVGAVANGVELLRDIGNAAAIAEIDMIDQSAQRANAVLRLHRLAFGANSGAAAEIARPAFARVLSDGLGSHRISVEVTELDGPALGYATGRAVGLAALCAQAMLGMRGRIGVELARDRPLPATVTAYGADTERKGPLMELIDTQGGSGAPIDPRQIEFCLLRAAAVNAGTALTHRISRDVAVFHFAPAGAE